MEELKKIIEAQDKQLLIHKDLIENQDSIIETLNSIIEAKDDKIALLEKLADKSAKMIVGQEELICGIQQIFNLEDDIIDRNFDKLDEIKNMLDSVGINYK